MRRDRVAQLVLSLSLLVCLLPASSAGADAKGRILAAKPQKEAAEQGNIAVDIVNMPESIKPGDAATVDVQAVPGAMCDIKVKLKSGVSKNSALTPRQADAQGKTSWTWTVAKNTSAGDAEVTVTAKLKGKTGSVKKTLKIAK